MAAAKPFSVACERNAEPILAVLTERLADRCSVLEIGSGTGQHAVHFAARLAHLTWQTSDVAANLPGVRQWLAEAALPNTPAPLVFDVNDPFPDEVDDNGSAENHPVLGVGPFDAVFSANTLHIMGWPEVQRLFQWLPRLMRAEAVLTVYGPFNDNGRFTSPSNQAFDASLRADHPKRGIRDLQAVDAQAQAAGLVMIEDRAMPANNRCVSWRRPGPRA